MIQARSSLIVSLERFMGRDINVLDPVDVGILSSWADGVFSRLRKFNYIPATKSFRDVPVIGFDKAVSDVSSMIGYATDLAGAVGTFYGIDTSVEKRTADTDKGDSIRALLSQWAFNVQDIVDFSGDSAGALAIVNDILNKNSSRGNQLLNVFTNFWTAAEGSFDLSQKETQQAYAGLVNALATILSRPTYFGITQGDIGGAFNKLVTVLGTAVTQKDANGN
ncbi:MAG: hypothetical protein NTZ48_04495, partial [Candidatus Omnitrophica bacterium]|nr:hypothetical protein [Candidatus Omnitrophota bacterium]